MNEARVAVISFSKTRRNYTEQNQANKLGGRQYPYYLAVKNCRTNKAEGAGAMDSVVVPPSFKTLSC